MKKFIKKIILFCALCLVISFVSSCSFFEKEINNQTSNDFNTDSNNSSREKLAVPTNVKLVGDEIVWNYMDNVSKYGVLINDVDYYETTTNRYKLTSSCTGYVKVRSMSTNEKYSNSNYSEPIAFNYSSTTPKKKLDTPKKYYDFVTNDSTYSGNKANVNKYSWHAVENASGYWITVTSKDETVNTHEYVTTLEYNVVLFKNHTITIKVKAVANGYNDSDELIESGIDYVPLEKHIEIKTLFDKGLGHSVDLSSPINNAYYYETISPFSIDKLANYIVVNKSVSSGQGKYETYTKYEQLIGEIKNTISIGLDASFPIKCVSVNIGGKYEFDKNSIDEKNEGQLYFSYHDYTQVAQGTIDYSNKQLLANCLSEGLLNEFKKVNSDFKAKTFFNTYGTHFIADAAYGGALDVIYSTYNIKEGSYKSVKHYLDANIGLGFNGIGVKSSGSWNNIKNNTSLKGSCDEKFSASYIEGENRNINSPNKFYELTYGWKQSIQNFQTTINNPNFAMIGVKKYISLISILEEIKDQSPNDYSKAYNYLYKYYNSI